MHVSVYMHVLCEPYPNRESERETAEHTAPDTTCPVPIHLPSSASTCNSQVQRVTHCPPYQRTTAPHSHSLSASPLKQCTLIMTPEACIEKMKLKCSSMHVFKVKILKHFCTTPSLLSRVQLKLCWFYMGVVMVYRQINRL